MNPHRNDSLSFPTRLVRYLKVKFNAGRFESSQESICLALVERMTAKFYRVRLDSSQETTHNFFLLSPVEELIAKFNQLGLNPQKTGQTI